VDFASSSFCCVKSLVLVTGGAGFIGSHTVDALVSRGMGVRVLDSLTDTAHVSKPDYLNDRAEYLWGDLCDADTAGRAVRGVTHVCHQASMVGLGRNTSDITAYVRQNDLATATLLAALAEDGFSGRFVLASSMVIYGEGLYLCEEHGSVHPGPRQAPELAAKQFDPACPQCGGALVPKPIPETAAPAPRSIYAATKLHQEYLCECFAREGSVIDLVTLRYHNVYGPRMPRDTPYSGVASVFRSSLAAGKPPPVFEDGNQLRDFIHVGDVARANVLALTAEAPINDTFNVATGTPRHVADLASALTHAAGSRVPGPEITGRFRLGDARHIFADAQRIQARLGFAAEIGLEQGMREFARAKLRDARATLTPTPPVKAGENYEQQLYQGA
jgi:dTDP-L-rhamnose 4-epimerase